MIIPIIKLIVLPIKWNQFFTQDKEINLPYEVELQDENIIIYTELGKTTRPWNHYAKWKENQKLILFYLADNRATPFPKRIFSEKELTYIYERLRYYNVPKARPINKLTCIFFIIFGLFIIVFTLALFIRFIYILIL